MELPPSLQNGLGGYYLLVALLNAGFAAHAFFSAKNVVKAAAWGAVALLFLIHSGAYYGHAGWVLPQGIRDAVDFVIGPVLYTSASIALFVVMLVFRRFFVKPDVAWAVLNLTLLAG